MPRAATRVIAVILSSTLVMPWSARAHNEDVHQRMTDYAYHVLLAGAAFSAGDPMSERLRFILQGLETSNPGLTTFFADARAAKPKLRALMSGLPLDKTPCATPFLVTAFGGPQPDWQLPPGTSLDALPMASVRLPVGFNYDNGVAVCDINATYEPSGVLATVNPLMPINPGAFPLRDYTGVTLGFWAAAPDKETKDWVLRSTTLETLQNPAVVAGIGASVSVAASAVCILACGLFPPACIACPVVAVGAGGAAIDEITSIDAESLESTDYVGFGHFIDVKPTPASPVFFDTKPAKFMERAGPNGVPDTTEDLVTILFDIGGIHVNHEKAEAPTNYQVILGASGAVGNDFHRNSIARTASEWELPTVPHLQLTPVDNLGMFGYDEARKNRGTPLETKRLGWPLHALGDASVPMHAVGASGYGHRPYEDSVNMVYDALVGSAGIAVSVHTVSLVVQRAFKWRKFIRDWRTLHGTSEVPVRDLVTAVAASTRAKANAQPAVFKAASSLLYIVDEGDADASYENPAMAAIQRDLLIDGIAAELAFLISVTEVMP